MSLLRAGGVAPAPVTRGGAREEREGSGVEERGELVVLVAGVDDAVPVRSEPASAGPDLGPTGPDLGWRASTRRRTRRPARARVSGAWCWW